jgi:hypothetical protein
VVGRYAYGAVSLAHLVEDLVGLRTTHVGHRVGVREELAGVPDLQAFATREVASRRVIGQQDRPGQLGSALHGADRFRFAEMLERVGGGAAAAVRIRSISR